MSNSDDKFDFVTRALHRRNEKHQFRELTTVEPTLNGVHINKEGQKIINFCSNDYLGLAQHPEVIARSAEFAEKYGAGATASRLVTGNYSIHEKLEKKLAETFDTEASLLFNTGFQANTSVLATVADRNSLILADKNVHNSLLQGAILSRAELIRFHHNDHDHLENLLQKASRKSYNRIWIITETVFSMDGDRNDLDALISLSERYGAFLFSDDAHAVGVLGENGMGLNYGMQGIHISLGTFGKAFGSFGAFVGTSNPMKDYLINFCPGFIYTTALPPAVVGAIDAALELIPTMDEERSSIQKNIIYLKNELREIGFETGDSNSQIIPVIIGDEKETLELSKQLEKEGIWAAAIRPPTVKKGSSRIRITLTAKHQKEDLNQLLSVFRNWKKT